MCIRDSLYSLPSDAMEAARVDGASSWQTFKYLTLPLLKPMTLFVVITSIISYIQAYVQVLILTEGGPGTATYLSSYIIYNAVSYTHLDVYKRQPRYWRRNPSATKTPEP